ELDHVEINPVSLANESYTDGQNIASDRYSSTNGNVNVGGIAHSFKTVSNGERALNGIQTGLDLLGMVPVFGEFADGFNAFLYAGRGDYVNASLSASAMVPFAGWASTSLKLGGKAAKGGQTVIGEGMKRVSTEAAKREGSVILNNMPNFTGTADQVTSQMMTFNRQWLLQQMRSGRPIIDIGLDPARGVPSIFYQMEQNMIKNYLKLHPNAFQVIKP
ncbi:hypothetical protein, partial [Sphingobacterium sp. LRF_L2]|uniref:hypothetical protein n=1 Tax=Sphingobacterium sp. LRF_L2 TaxID=3369421 RepID=UPI003F600903